MPEGPVSISELPVQKLVPLEVAVLGGSGFTVTTTGAELAEQVALEVTSTE